VASTNIFNKTLQLSLMKILLAFPQLFCA